jgi:uncharacterized surface protein with fasciclin (FAS1) repeats
MRSWRCSIILAGLSCGFAHAQSFLESISSDSSLDQFRSLLTSNPTLASLLTFNSTSKVTVLVPSNAAFDQYQATYGVDISSLPTSELTAILQYQILNGQYTLANLVGELVVPTYLTGQQYNNRTAGPGINVIAAGHSANTSQSGQVVILNSNNTSSSGGKMAVRQSGVGGVTVVSGLDTEANLTITDGLWENGVYQIINQFLTLPESCTSSLLQKNLTGLSTALNRTDLGPTVDTANNFTCIAPSNQAFLMSGSPQLHANIYNLSQMVTYHTIDQPVYGDFLQNGQVYTSIGNDQIVVTVNDSGTYFNGAKIIERDIIMDNGVLHVIDQVMAPNNASGTATSSASSSSTSKAAAPAMLSDRGLLQTLSVIETLLISFFIFLV